MIRVISSRRGHVSFITDGIENEIAKTLRNADRRFPTYRSFFERNGINIGTLSDAELVNALTELDPFSKSDYLALQQDSLEVQASTLFTIDSSSGSTFKPILKFTSPHDDEAEAAAVRLVLDQLRLVPSDRVLCVDVGASDIYLFYSRILCERGIRAPSFLSITNEYRHYGSLVARLDPTVIISVPSVLNHILDGLVAANRARGSHSLRKVLYIGEPMDDMLRERIHGQLGAECFSFYGTTEVGSVGAECCEHNGIHVPLELFVPTLIPWPHGTKRVARLERYVYEGAVAWTTIRKREQPAIVYAVNDLVRLDTRPCRCGLESPRIHFVRRIDEAFSLFGLTFTYDVFLRGISRCLGELVDLEVRVERNAEVESIQARDCLTFVLADRFRHVERFCREGVLSIYPIDSMVWCGLLRIRFRFVEEGYFHRRKTRRLELISPDTGGSTPV